MSVDRICKEYITVDGSKFAFVGTGQHLFVQNLGFLVLSLFQVSGCQVVFRFRNIGIIGS